MEAALHVLSERPQASMRDIADASHLGRTTVYRHFATRDELVTALLDRVGTEAREAFAACVSAGGSADEVLRRIARAFVAIGERFRFLEQYPALRAERVSALADEAEQPWSAWLAEAQARGELRQDMPVPVMRALHRAMTFAIADEIALGRVRSDEAGRLYGDVLVAALCA
jgi:AcrR family transcriptional regulator